MLLKKNIFYILVTALILMSSLSAEEKKLIEVDWSFKGVAGNFDRSSLQRGYRVYTEVCASCHSMNLLSYRNLGENGGPEFSIEKSDDIFRIIDVGGSTTEGISKNDNETYPGFLQPLFEINDIKNVEAAQTTFNHRAKMCTLAAQGKWSSELENK